MEANLSPLADTLESLISDNPSVHRRLRRHGARTVAGRRSFEQALNTYQKAAEATPASIARLAESGHASLLLWATATKPTRALERATSLGVSSKMYDFQALVMLAQIRFDEKDLQGCSALPEAMSRRPTRRCPTVLA
jgi:hypothetical protein